MSQPFLSICIPSYNRAQFLKPLLDSIICQTYQNFEIMICEDLSPQREEIKNIIDLNYKNELRIKLYLNEVNLGYDANFRELLSKSQGEYCFFMGNDDLMAPGALKKVAEVLEEHTDVGLILRSYSWFVSNPEKPEQTVRYFDEDRIFPPGAATIATAYRRCGVLSGYIIHRDTALEFDTNEFDSFLYYQMYLAACILTKKQAYYIHDVITYSRSTESPDFGNSSKEKSIFTPGKYTPSARIHMVTGMLTIAKGVQQKTNVYFYDKVERDIANYVYPYISDQLDLSPIKFYKFYRNMGKTGLKRHKMFHIHFLVAYILKEKGYNYITKIIREKMGRSPSIGSIYEGEAVR